ETGFDHLEAALTPAQDLLHAVIAAKCHALVQQLRIAELRKLILRAEQSIQVTAKRRVNRTLRQLVRASPTLRSVTVSMQDNAAVGNRGDAVRREIAHPALYHLLVPLELTCPAEPLVPQIDVLEGIVGRLAQEPSVRLGSGQPRFQRCAP